MISLNKIRHVVKSTYIKIENHILRKSFVLIYDLLWLSVRSSCRPKYGIIKKYKTISFLHSLYFVCNFSIQFSIYSSLFQLNVQLILFFNQTIITLIIKLRHNYQSDPSTLFFEMFAHVYFFFFNLLEICHIYIYIYIKFSHFKFVMVKTKVCVPKLH